MLGWDQGSWAFPLALPLIFWRTLTLTCMLRAPSKVGIYIPCSPYGLRVFAGIK